MADSSDAIIRKPDETIWQHFSRLVAGQPDETAVVDGERRWTYRDLAQQSASIARAFLSLGVRRGDHVAVLLKNCPEWIALHLAITQIGAVIVPLNTRCKAEDLGYLLRQSDSVVVVMMREFVGIDYHAILAQIIRQVGDPALPKLRQVVSFGQAPFAGGISFEQFVAQGRGISEAELDAVRTTVTADDHSLIIYTSGTTGYAKGAIHDQGQVLLSSATLARRFGAGDRVLALGPYFHIMGFSYGAAGPVMSGAASVVLATFDAGQALGLIERERISVTSGTPTMYQMMMARPEFARCELSSLRYVMLGGARATPALVEEILQRFPGVHVSSGFGMSETMGSTASPPGDTPENIANTCGFAYSYLAVRIVDPERGEDMPRGSQGELWLRGLNVTRGYYNLPEETAAAITPDGWLRTGDLFIQEADGHLRMTGRLKDMYIRGGTNVYPAEVENLLSRHAEIEQAWIVGVPDETYGEVGAAFVELKAGAHLDEKGLKDYCRQRIAGYKMPHYVYFANQFPLTASGKIRKVELRRQACELLGLDE